MSLKNLVIGTRSSPLALYQANYIKDCLQELDGSLDISLCKIKTTGDKILDVPLAKVGGKGLFVKEIEEALLRKEIDLAVHSMKDVPVEFPDGLGITAVSKREDPRDALISRNDLSFNDLPNGAKIGTSSLRRKTQLLSVRPDLNISDIRGNVQTRLRKLKDEGLDATILAAAGLKRLGMEDLITEYLPVSLSLPAIGQGVMGVESRLDDEPVNQLLAKINDEQTDYAIKAERSFLLRLEGGCQVPIGAYATLSDDDYTLNLEGFVGSLDGKITLRDVISGKPENAAAMGLELAEKMIENGAGDILKEVYGG